MNLAQLSKVVADEAKAFEMIEKLRWPSGPVCPHCGATDRIYDLRKTRAGLRKCGHCRKQFTVRVGSIFEDSPLPLGKWILAIHLMCSSKKGISSNQLKRELGISYQSAWFLTHRIRLAMTKEPLAGMLGGGGGMVEIDETYIGGKPENNLHRNKTKAAGKKVAVLTLVDRAGEAKTYVVPNTKRTTLEPIIRSLVDPNTIIMTDDYASYDKLKKQFRSHRVINHGKAYVRAEVHTNFAESYHSLLKRGLFGAYHHVSEKHLPRYLKEFEFRWNSRKTSDGDRTNAAIAATGGKRLTYKPLKNTPKGTLHQLVPPKA